MPVKKSTVFVCVCVCVYTKSSNLKCFHLVYVSYEPLGYRHLPNTDGLSWCRFVFLVQCLPVLLFDPQSQEYHHRGRGDYSNNSSSWHHHCSSQPLDSVCC